MATLLLLDLTHLSHAHLELHEPPPSWYCAAELAQWKSPTAVEDAWQSLQGLTAAIASPCSSSSYQLQYFPATVVAANRYFTTLVRLCVGAEAAVPHCRNGSANRNTKMGVDDWSVGSSTAADLRHCYAAFIASCSAYGVVLVVKIAQDTSEVPWHIFTSGPALFHIVLVVEEEKERGADPIGAKHQRERWNEECIERGFEVIYHTSVRGAMELPVVSSSACRSGLLGGTLSGSDRILQVLCNALWPVETRQRSAASATGQASSPQQGDTETEKCDNFAVVISNHPLVVHRCLLNEGGATSRVASCRFYTCSSSQTLAEGNAAPHSDAFPQLVLVNRYYATAVELYQVPTAFFDLSMSDVLRRRWESMMLKDRNTEIARDGRGSPLRGDAPLLLLFWPPVELVSSAESEKLSAQAIDTRWRYPSFDKVIQSVRHLSGMQQDLVVVTQYTAAAAISVGQGSDSLTDDKGVSALHRDIDDLSPYEQLLCDELNIEVVRLGSPTEWREAAVGEAPVTGEVGGHEICGVDRLRELLHCVEWNVSLPYRDAPTRQVAAAPLQTQNSCLLCTFGPDAATEEEWLRRFYSVTAGQSSCTSKEGGVTAVTAVVGQAVPSVAPHLDGADVTVSTIPFRTRYYEAEVRVETRGGIWAAQHPPEPLSRSAVSGFLDCFNAYVIFIDLPTLRQQLDSPSSEFALLCTELVQRALQERLHDDAAVSSKFTDGAADLTGATPLVMLHVVDVSSRAEEQQQEVCHLLRMLLRSTPAKSEVLCGSRELEEAGWLEYPELLIEVVWAEMEAPPTPVTPTDQHLDNGGDGSGVWPEGLRRIKEGMEQHVWPHRKNLRTEQPVPAAPSAVAVAEAFNSHQDPAADAKETECLPEVTPRLDACRATCADLCGSIWIAPVVGCELPETYLVDPSTLRSVHVAALHATIPMDASHSGMPSTLEQRGEELMMWAEKMKQWGSRLGPTQRELQAAKLASALGAVL